jgi:L-rhamnose mutarotase
MRRVGMVIELKADQVEEYKRVHSGDDCTVRDLLQKHNLRRFSIYLTEIDGRFFEFAYLEHTGDDYDADMAALGAEPRNQAWLAVTDPMQLPLHGGDSWTQMEEIFHND